MSYSDDMPEMARIEAGLARDRATVADTLDALRDRLTVDALMSDAKTILADNIGPLTAGIDRTVRGNPLAVALIGAGLAWLVIGRNRAERKPASIAGTRRDALIRWEDEGGPAHDPQVADDMTWMHESDSLRDKARAALARVEEAARAGFSTVARTAEDRAEVLSRYARDASRALRHGLDDLPTTAQDKIVALREQAYRLPRAAASAPGRMIEDQPMVAGVVALVVGAGLAVALPRTTTEDRLFGAERDRLVDHAQIMLRAERARAADVVADLAGTLRAELHTAAVQYPRAVGS